MKKSTEDREHELLAAILAGQQAKGYAPTRRELAATIGVSTARVQQIVNSCTRKGLLSCPPRTARAYVVQVHPTTNTRGTCRGLPSKRKES